MLTGLPNFKGSAAYLAVGYADLRRDILACSIFEQVVDLILQS